MTRILLLRHGQSVTNLEKRYTGQADVPLSELGEEQARLAGAYILQNYGVDAVYASDLCRAVNTAAPVADALGLPVHIDPDLREIHVGCWTGIPFEEIARLWPKEREENLRGDTDFRFAGGESYGDLRRRTERAIRKIVAENPGKTVLVATHGGFVRSFLCWMRGLPVERRKELGAIVNNATLTVAEFSEDGGRLVTVGYGDYLEGRLTR